MLWGLQVRGFPCECSWPECCDSQGGGMPPTRMALAAQQTGALHTSAAAASLPAHSPAQSQDMPRPSGEPEPTGRISGGSADGSAVDCSAAGCSRCREPDSAADSISAVAASERHPGGLKGGLEPAQPGSGRCEAVDENDAELERMEARYVHSVYDIIATHFSATRFAIWPKVPTFPACCLIHLSNFWYAAVV